MDNLIIKPHSFVDIITNSSTVIYTYVSDLGSVIEFVDAVLQSVPNNALKADDLFEIKEVIVSPNLVVDCILNDADNRHHETLSKINKDLKGSWNDLNQYVIHNVSVEEFEHLNNEEYHLETGVYIKPREGTSPEFGSLLNRVFDSVETYG